jgi:ABC-type glycerol-3-phosphate transport system substrate-binding protein
MLYWSRSWSRRIPPAALFAALIAILAATLSPCGGSSSVASGPVNLTFWGFNQQIADQAKIFNDTHPNIHVTGIKQDSGPNQYHPKSSLP